MKTRKKKMSKTVNFRDKNGVYFEDQNHKNEANTINVDFNNLLCRGFISIN